MSSIKDDEDDCREEERGNPKLAEDKSNASKGTVACKLQFKLSQLIIILR